MSKLFQESDLATNIVGYKHRLCSKSVLIHIVVWWPWHSTIRPSDSVLYECDISGIN
jgi:hypothetical protein